MATIFERPVSILRDSIEPRAPEPVIPQRRRRESAEVIDVDLLNDELTQRPARRRRRARTPELISLVDSDDEPEQPVASGSGIRRAANRLISPPPPAPNDDGPPPVPPLPFALAPYTSLPRRPQPFPSPQRLGVVRANDRPFEFEQGLMAGPQSAPDPPRPRPRPTPHTAHIGLGGAIIAATPSEREQRIMQAAARSRRNRHNVAVDIPLPIRRNRIQRGLNLFLFHGAGMYDDDDDDNYWGGLFGTRARSPLREVEYKNEYTHPNPPDGSFAHDFEVAPAQSVPTDKAASHFPVSSKSNPIVVDDDGEIVESRPTEPPAPVNMSTVLVCAHCLSPLVMGATVPESRVWGLRCGHLIDGACLAKLAIPDESEEASLADPKGKGKAKAREAEPPVPIESIIDPFADNPIRSRLRSSTNNEPSLLEQYLPSIFLKRSRPKTAKTKKPVIEASHTWTCPVSGCGKEHTSIKMDGIWTQEKDKGQGAIALFI